MKKSNFIISFFIIICLFTFFFIYKDAKIILDKSKNRSFVEQRSVTTIGYENGSPVFKININNVRQESYKHILFANGVINGTVFNTDNHKVITNLSGDNGRINTHIKSILVTGNIHATIHPSKSKRIIKIIANEFFYTHRKKESRFKDNAQLISNDLELKSEKFTYNNNTEVISFNALTTIKNKNSITELNQALLNTEDSILTASNNVKSTYINTETNSENSPQLQKLSQNKTIIKADSLILDFKNDEYSIVTYNNNVNISQTDKSLSADKVILNFNNDQFNATGNIHITFDDLNWLKDTDKNYKNKKIKSMLGKKTSLYSNNANFDSKTNLFTLNKNVKIKQLDFRIVCDTFIFDFNKDIITAEGNVKVFKFGIEHLKTSKMIINILDETFKTGANNQLSEIILDL